MRHRIKHEPDIADLWYIFSSYKDMAKFYEENKDMPTREDIENRIEFLLKNKVRQRNEMETLYWILGKEIPNEKN